MIPNQQADIYQSEVSPENEGEELLQIGLEEAKSGRTERAIGIYLALTVLFPLKQAVKSKISMKTRAESLAEKWK